MGALTSNFVHVYTMFKPYWHNCPCMVQLQKLEDKVEELKKNKRSSTSSTGSKFQMESPTSSKHFLYSELCTFRASTCTV